MQGPHVGLAHLLDAASVGALERPGGNNITALNLQSRPDVDDELILAATNCFPCLRWVCWPHGLPGVMSATGAA